MFKLSNGDARRSGKLRDPAGGGGNKIGRVAELKSLAMAMARKVQH